MRFRYGTTWAPMRGIEYSANANTLLELERGEYIKVINGQWGLEHPFKFWDVITEIQFITNIRSFPVLGKTPYGNIQSFAVSGTELLYVAGGHGGFVDGLRFYFAHCQ